MTPEFQLYDNISLKAHYSSQISIRNSRICQEVAMLKIQKVLIKFSNLTLLIKIVESLIVDVNLLIFDSLPPKWHFNWENFPYFIGHLKFQSLSFFQSDPLFFSYNWGRNSLTFFCFFWWFCCVIFIWLQSLSFDKFPETILVFIIFQDPNQ